MFIDGSLPAEWSFGVTLGRWISTLDATNDELLYFCIRYDEVVREPGHAVKELYEAFQRLRRQIAPKLSTEQVEGMDALLASAQWFDLRDASVLCNGYFSVRTYRDKEGNELLDTEGCENWPMWKKEGLRRYLFTKRAELKGEALPPEEG